MNVQRIAALIEQSGKRKNEVARLAGISRTTLDNLLDGADVKISTISAVASVLGVRAVDLITDGDEERINYMMEIKRMEDEHRAMIARLNSLIDAICPSSVPEKKNIKRK